MIIDSRCMAPHFGTWHSTYAEMPDMGMVVLGLAWSSESMAPVVMLMEWRVIEDSEDYNPDHVFEVRDEHSNHRNKHAVWFEAFADLEADGSTISLVPPLMWAEARWLVLTPYSICGDCQGLKMDGKHHPEDCNSEQDADDDG